MVSGRLRPLKVRMVNASCIGRPRRIIMTKIKERLKPISFYGHKLEDVIRAFLQVDPKRVKEEEYQEKTKYRIVDSKKEKP
jgi:hypothetical protein